MHVLGLFGQLGARYIEVLARNSKDPKGFGGLQTDQLLDLFLLADRSERKQIRLDR